MTYTPAMVTTIDGRQCLADSETWRSVCEAVWTLGKPEIQRSEWMAQIEKRRGAAGRQSLQDEMDRVEPAYLLAMADRDTRRAYLAQVERYRGAWVREDLERRLVALWEQRKAAAAA